MLRLCPFGCGADISSSARLDAHLAEVAAQGTARRRA